VTIVFALTAVACPGSTPTKLDIIALDYEFEPATIAADATTLAITLHNQGAVEHDLEILNAERVAGHIEVVQPGLSHSRTIEVVPGVYRMICTVDDHEQRGMVGTLTIR
jgi:plastocyanin